jgi:hypothetical protein
MFVAEVHASSQMSRSHCCYSPCRCSLDNLPVHHADEKVVVVEEGVGHTESIAIVKNVTTRTFVVH